MIPLVGLVFSGALFLFTFLKSRVVGKNKILKNEHRRPSTFSKTIYKAECVPPPTVPFFEMTIKNIRDKLSLVKLFSYFGTLQPVVLLKLFQVRFAVINDVKLANECLQSVKFAGKSSSDGYCFHAQGQYGLLNTHGKKWEEQRKFCLRHLKNYGFKTRSIESLIQTEVDEFLDKLTASKGTKISPNKLFYLPVLNSLWSLLAGQRFANDQAKMYKLTLELFDDVGRIFKLPDAVLLLFPLNLRTLSWIAEYMPFLFSGWARLRKNVLELRAYLKTKIDERQRSFEPDEIPQDFVDAYLQEIHRNTDPNSVFAKECGEMNLLGTLTEFFIAGGDTTATMISWCILHLVRSPEIQREIQKEIDSVVGRDRRPSVEDQAKCHYTQAFIWEVLRFNPVTITTTPREVSEDTRIGSYTVAKGTPVLLNIIGVHQSPRIWGDPHTFRPERFLSPDRKFVKGVSVMSFSTGKRKCPGRQLARDNLFLFVTSICQRFFLEKDPQLKSEADLSLEAVYNGGFLVPKPYYMVAHERQ